MNSGAPSTNGGDSGDRLAYIALALVPGLGARRLARLLSTFGSARDVVDAPLDALQGCEGISGSMAAAIKSPPLREAERTWRQAERDSQHTLVPSDASYPAVLRTIPDPPLVLFARGDLSALSHPAVAIVGSRAHTAYGAEVARLMAGTAARAGITVVSGLARGLDAVAQAAALDAGGISIGVLGTGADVVYPPENRQLFERLLPAGLLLTEHPPGDRGHRGAFPRRNRLISGLCRALVVVEAAEASGTLITVTCALEQGREVLAVPGPINSPTSAGTNRLLRDGATPLLAPRDLLAVFGISVADATRQRPMQTPCDLSPEEARTLSALTSTPMFVDDVGIATGLPTGILLATLLGLELGGLVEQLPSGAYRRR